MAFKIEQYMVVSQSPKISIHELLTLHNNSPDYEYGYHVCLHIRITVRLSIHSLITVDRVLIPEIVDMSPSPSVPVFYVVPSQMFPFPDFLILIQ